MRQAVFFLAALIVAPAEARGQYTCETLLDDFSESSRDMTIGAYVMGYTDALGTHYRTTGDGQVPGWLKQRYQVFALETEIVCDHYPKWLLRQATEAALTELRRRAES